MDSAPSSAGRPHSDRWSNPWLGLIPVGIAFVVMAWLSWKKWPDVLIDFGLQLYIPLQLAEGKRLYDDIAYLPGGPLSQHYHALLFRLFGPSLNILVTSNLAIFGALTVAVYRSFQTASDRLTATWAGIFFVAAFGFSHYVEFGNYNFVTPYSHEMFHGLGLSIILLIALERFLKSGASRHAGLAGLLVGAIFLTKPEVFLAAAVTTTVAFGLAWWNRREHPSRSQRGWMMLIVAALIPPTLFSLYFASFTPGDGAIKKVCWAWIPLLTSGVSHGNFYRTGLGLDAPAQYAGWMLLHFAVLVTALALLAWRTPLARNRSWERIALLVAAGAGSLYFEWLSAGRSLPLLMLATFGFIIWHNRHDIRASRHFPPFMLLWTIFGGMLLAKMGFHSHVWHYGAFLAMPAMLAVIYLFLWLLPHTIPRLNLSRSEFRSVIICFLAFGLFRLIVQSWLYYHDKTVSIGRPPDQFLTARANEDLRTTGLLEALSWIESNIQPQATLAVLPEGAMLNYLTRRTNPTPYLVFMAEMDAFGEATMLAAYQKTPPDFVALVQRDTDEYGPGWWGERKGFGRDMMAWLRSNYEPVHLIGTKPFTSGDFGIEFLQRK